MVTVFQQMSTGRYTHTGQFESWLFRIAMNRVRDAARRSRRRREGPLAGSRIEGPDRAERGATGEADALRSALASLPEADQEIISLRHHAQLGFAAIAEMLGQPMGTVLARHHRAIGKLRKLMEPVGSHAEGAR